MKTRLSSAYSIAFLLLAFHALSDIFNLGANFKFGGLDRQVCPPILYKVRVNNEIFSGRGKLYFLERPFSNLTGTKRQASIPSDKSTRGILFPIGLDIHWSNISIIETKCTRWGVHSTFFFFSSRRLFSTIFWFLCFWRRIKPMASS